MKTYKIIAIIVAIIIGGLLTAPYWGGCGISHQLCELGCEIRHFGSSFDKITCKGSCAADRLACESQ